jgi:hypothetical protein
MTAFLLSELVSEITKGSVQLNACECNKEAKCMMKNKVRNAEKYSFGFIGKEFPVKLWDLLWESNRTLKKSN